MNCVLCHCQNACQLQCSHIVCNICIESFVLDPSVQCPLCSLVTCFSDVPSIMLRRKIFEEIIAQASKDMQKSCGIIDITNMIAFNAAKKTECLHCRHPLICPRPDFCGLTFEVSPSTEVFLNDISHFLSCSYITNNDLFKYYCLACYYADRISPCQICCQKIVHKKYGYCSSCFTAFIQPIIINTDKKVNYNDFIQGHCFKLCKYPNCTNILCEPKKSLTSRVKSLFAFLFLVVHFLKFNIFLRLAVTN